MNEIIHKIEPENQKYYEVLRSEEDKSRRVGWKNSTAQTIRFDQISSLFGRDELFSINDLGCGLGHLMEYLKDRGQNFSHYYGYDLMDEMVKQCNELHNHCQKSTFKLIVESNEMDTHDYTVASGIFNLKHGASDSEWLQYIQHTIEIMWKKSTKGVAFNMLTFYSDETHKRKELYYSSPEEIFSFCARNITRNIALLHDYEQFDFTVILRK